MSAIVCGKRSFFEDLPTSPNSASPPAAKKLRCFTSTSPVRFSPFTNSPPSPSLIDKLRSFFPSMDKKLLEKALEKSGNDLGSAIKSLNELCLGYADGASGSPVQSNAITDKGSATASEDIVSLENPSANDNIPKSGAEWVELFVTEMTSATSIDDARLRAMRVLESLERSISEHAGGEAAENLRKENLLFKEQIEVLLRENAILKRAVAIQHERQKEYDERTQEVQQLKQLLSQYQEQLRTLEVNNYALTMHLRQAQDNNSIPGRFHPDIF
ncbi:uncharacterized protein LOC112516951 [Cynara cardunculus var. scolymus]|uniref:uncharacterized protein LOC112516951 n=1 Tax=Cynara cardunculus var. scolymus TaxID=59895 RepID=UPI000D629E05|nr:uncharacterized protein LOC112516951 [Cynara cardunculus var. scolymus]